MENNSSLRFQDLFDMDRLQELQDAFADLTGTASVITDRDGIAITRPSNFTKLCRDVIKQARQGLLNCRQSDLVAEAAIGSPDADGPVITECLSSGLWDAGAGIYLGDTHIANWLVGQVRDIATDDSHFLEYARRIGADENLFMEALSEVTAMSRDKFESICRTLYLMTQQLSKLAYQNIALKREMETRKAAEEEQRKIEAQMLNSQKLESLGVLAGGIAHDFNNLLMVILGNADLAIGSLPDGGGSSGHLVEIKKVARQAADLCNQMLAYSGKGQFVIETIDLNQMIREMTHILEMSASRNATIVYHLTKEPVAVRGDPGQLKQVIMNLVFNASEAIGDSTGLISISTGAVRKNGIEDSGSLIGSLPDGDSYSYLEVSDNGCGMDEATLNRLFDPFFSTKLTGRGLGMAAVLGIIRGHSAAISVSSEPGCGSTFKFYLPVPDKTTVSDAVPETHDGSSGNDGISGTVLLVDDEEGVRNVAAEMMECLGFHVLTASDGQQALDILSLTPDSVDCVLLDLTMPGLSGEETCREMQRIDPNVRIIVSSGFNEKDASERIPLNDLSGFLQKPYGLTALYGKLRDILD